MKLKDKIIKLKKELKERIGCIESDDLNESIQFVKEKKKCLEKLPSQAIAPLRSSQWKTSPSDYFSLVTKNSKSYGAKVEPSTIFISNNAARSDEFRISAAANENAPFIKVPPLYINFVKKLQKIYKFSCVKSSSLRLPASSLIAAIWVELAAARMIPLLAFPPRQTWTISYSSLATLASSVRFLAFLCIWIKCYSSSSLNLFGFCFVK